jgi:hypothetical protein
MGNAVQVPYPFFSDVDGRPLDRGSVYIGVSGLNPLAPGNRQAVYWDAALTQPAAQPIRTLMGYLSNNGKPAHPYVAGDYSIVAQDRLGKTVFSELVNTTLASDLLMTQARGTLSRSMRTPSSFNMDLILESGFYAWTNQAASNLPAGLVATDSFALQVLASPDASGLVVQNIRDLMSLVVYERQSQDAGASWSPWTNINRRSAVTTSGALGALTDKLDKTYYLSAASTATLPTNLVAVIGQRLTFKNKGLFTTTISAAVGQTIGTTSSTSFSLYAQEDYVTLEYDGTSVWYVVATNGPVVSVNQTSQPVTGTDAWTAMGGGLTLGSVPPGVYDFELDCTLLSKSSAVLAIAIGNNVTPITAEVAGQMSTGFVDVFMPAHVGVKGYVLLTAATIQAIYRSQHVASYIDMRAGYTYGNIRRRRIG